MAAIQAFLVAGALALAGPKALSSERAERECNPVRARPVAFELRQTVVVAPREEEIVIEPIEPRAIEPARDQWRVDPARGRVRDGWLGRVVRVIEAL